VLGGPEGLIYFVCMFAMCGFGKFPRAGRRDRSNGIHFSDLRGVRPESRISAFRSGPIPSDWPNLCCHAKFVATADNRAAMMGIHNTVIEEHLRPSPHQQSPSHNGSSPIHGDAYGAGSIHRRAQFVDMLGHDLGRGVPASRP
jgi:hypothetical protein